MFSFQKKIYSALFPLKSEFDLKFIYDNKKIDTYLMRLFFRNSNFLKGQVYFSLML